MDLKQSTDSSFFKISRICEIGSDQAQISRNTQKPVKSVSVSLSPIKFYFAVI